MQSNPLPHPPHTETELRELAARAREAEMYFRLMAERQEPAAAARWLAHADAQLRIFQFLQFPAIAGK